MAAMTTPPPRAPGLVDAPEALARELAPWVQALVEQSSATFRALYLHGSALTPQFDPQGSDANLLLVVADLPFDRLKALARTTRELAARAPRARRVTPLVLTEPQIRKSVDVFPAEFLDLAARRALLAGTDVLGGIVIGLGNLRHQCEYELRAKQLGLRQAFLLAGGAPGIAQQVLAQAAGGLGAVLRQLLALRGAPAPGDPDALVAAVARTYGVDAGALGAPFAARRGQVALAAHLGVLEALIDAVDALPVS